jgi:enoyl-CoA hydratase
MKSVGNKSVLTERINNSLLIVFNRPEIRNPLSIELLDELHEVLAAALSDTCLQNVIFTGTGNIFASGANLNEIAQVTGATAREFAVRGQSLMDKIASARQTTIAAVNGFCYGGALDLAMSCGRRIATPNAVFCHPGANLGIMTGWGGTQRLPRLIGEAQALEMFLTARQVTAKEALRIGLIDEVTENIAVKIAEITGN